MTMSKIFETLQAALGADVVIDAARAAERASSYWDPSPMRAAALVRPRTTADLSAALKICDGAKQKIVTPGGLTGCDPGAPSPPDTVIVSHDTMKVTAAMDPIGRTDTVPAGVTRPALPDPQPPRLRKA